MNFNKTCTTVSENRAGIYIAYTYNDVCMYVQYVSIMQYRIVK